MCLESNSHHIEKMTAFKRQSFLNPFQGLEEGSTLGHVNEKKNYKAF